MLKQTGLSKVCMNDMLVYVIEVCQDTGVLSKKNICDLIPEFISQAHREESAGIQESRMPGPVNIAATRGGES